MPNRLKNESSPYLLQHANNPVDWYPWGEEALAASKKLDRPIFLSIGYSACHWCHVMEHESFEDEEIARVLNENFICIKVDREERPDIDMIYMEAVMALKNGQGGWPLSAFLTPDQQVFYGGTYWPPKPRMGMPGFNQVLTNVIDAYTNKRDTIKTQSADITDWLNRPAAEAGEIDAATVTTSAAWALENQFDFTHGGFGTKPKFPHAMDLSWLNLVATDWGKNDTPARKVIETMVDLNLRKMALGGIYDHLGGGFARYSVDERWLVPHFEKMLYDNALLTMAYTERCQRHESPFFATVVQETIDYVLELLTSPEGGFYSTEDADSEGEEGKFYVWTPQEIEKVLGKESASKFAAIYDVTDNGNFEGKNILNLTDRLKDAGPEDMFDVKTASKAARQQLLAVRNKRVRPGLDDKVIVSWNGLMIRAIARAATVFENETWKLAAVKAAEFILQHLSDKDGRLQHTWRNGKASIGGYLDDYAAMVWAFVELYRLTFDDRWVTEAQRLCDLMLKHFGDESPGFFFTADDAEKLIARQKPWHDNSVPGGNSLAACALIELGRLTGNQSLLEKGWKTVEAASHVLNRAPHAASQMLVAMTMSQSKPREIVIAGKPSVARPLIERLQKLWLPGTSLILLTDPKSIESGPLKEALAGKEFDSETVTLFDCESLACKLPVVGEEKVRKWIDELESGVAR